MHMYYPLREKGRKMSDCFVNALFMASNILIRAHVIDFPSWFHEHAYMHILSLVRSSISYSIQNILFIMQLLAKLIKHFENLTNYLEKHVYFKKILFVFSWYKYASYESLFLNNYSRFPFLLYYILIL